MEQLQRLSQRLKEQRNSKHQFLVALNASLEQLADLFQDTTQTELRMFMLEVRNTALVVRANTETMRLREQAVMQAVKAPS